MFTIENDRIKVTVANKGAELMSIYHKTKNKECLWQGDAKFWNRRAPILFPIVGKLKDNTMSFSGSKYQMMQHGFARDMEFDLTSITAEKLTFRCQSCPETKKMYPFDWMLSCDFKIKDNVLEVSTHVKNTSSDIDMLFSIGYHPAFNVPVYAVDGKLENYSLHFNKDISADKWVIKEGLIDIMTAPGFDNSIILYHTDLFRHDALVFKNLKSDEITLVSKESKPLLKFKFSGFPYLGIWSKPNAPFVCIEPWHGIADSVAHDGVFDTKKGIISLKPQRESTFGYEVMLL